MQIHRRRHRHRAFDDGGSRIGLFAQPFEQHIAAKRYADDIDFAVGIFALEPAQDPVDLGGIAGVIGARQLVSLAAAAAKVRHDAAPTMLLCAAPSNSARSGCANRLRGRETTRATYSLQQRPASNRGR